MTHYEGTCDVCSQTIALDHDPASGIIDIGITDDDQIYTWTRHPDGPNPDCAVYSSRVYQTNPGVRMTDRINLPELRERAKWQAVYRKAEELHDWPVEEVLALLDTAEAAQELSDHGPGSGRKRRLDDTLARFTFDQETNP